MHNAAKSTTDCRSVSCEVEFAPLAEAEIEWYLDAGDWQGAAGAYRLQGMGGCLIKSMSGSPSAVAGLPLRDFYVMLRDNGYRFGA
jgi:septum formation protein